MHVTVMLWGSPEQLRGYITLKVLLWLMEKFAEISIGRKWNSQNETFQLGRLNPQETPRAMSLPIKYRRVASWGSHRSCFCRQQEYLLTSLLRIWNSQKLMTDLITSIQVESKNRFINQLFRIHDTKHPDVWRQLVFGVKLFSLCPAI